MNWPPGGLTEGSLRWLIAYQLAAVIAFVLVIGTLTLPRTARDRGEASSLGFGYPISFVSVDETRWDPPSYPQTYRYSPWEDGTDVNGWRFALDWLLVTGALWIPIWLFRRRRA